jgi:hypothetical protein
MGEVPLLGEYPVVLTQKDFYVVVCNIKDKLIV